MKYTQGYKEKENALGNLHKTQIVMENVVGEADRYFRNATQKYPLGPIELGRGYSAEEGVIIQQILAEARMKGFALHEIPLTSDMDLHERILAL